MPFFVTRNAVTVSGLRDGDFITKEQLQSSPVAFRILPATELKKSRFRIDGTPLRVMEQSGALTWLPPRLQDGEHKLLIQSGARFLWRPPTTKTVRFTVDSQPPRLVVITPDQPLPLDKPYVLRGTVNEAATIAVSGVETKVANGTFSRSFPFPPIGGIEVRATDTAGNQNVVMQFPRLSYPVIRGVHMSAISWITPSLKTGVLRMADDGKINTVQLDLKDESGIVGYRSALAQVANLGSSTNLFDLRDAVTELHSRGLRVVGRLVVFRDPVYTAHALVVGNLDDIVQAPDGSPYKSKYGGFTNPLSSRVHDYNLAIAREAADAGIDDILFDYIRRPEGPISQMKFPGLIGDPYDAIDAGIAAFLTKTAKTLSGTPARVGISVFGVALAESHQIGQNVPRMANLVDYVAPMVYPSLWRSGQYNVTNPGLQPGVIVGRSLAKFQEAISTSGAILVPWLQDFSLNGNTYGAAEVRAQIDAAQATGIQGFLMWDPKVTYSGGGLPNDAPVNKFAEKQGGTTPPIGATGPSSNLPRPTAATVPPSGQ